MKYAALALALFVAAPVCAQTANDDMKATENWWDAVGADFFSEASMQEPRPASEIRAQWTGLSADDQAAILARCAGSGGQAAAAPSLQEGLEDEDPDATRADLADGALSDTDQANGAADPGPAESETTTTGSVDGTEVQTASPSQTPAPDTGLAGGSGETAGVLICDLVPNL